MAKDIKFDIEARDGLKRGVDALANAVNDNTTWGGKGRDIGIFQINTFWQKMYNEKLLMDPAINIRIAYKLFKDNGFSFKLWTCGKVYGI